MTFEEKVMKHAYTIGFITTFFLFGIIFLCYMFPIIFIVLLPLFAFLGVSYSIGKVLSAGWNW